MASDCLFCKIIRREIPADFVDESEWGVVIRDIKPEAPVHLLVIPRRHLSSLLEADDARELGDLMLLAARVANAEAIGTSGFRIVANTGADAGQSVAHLHIHVMGGRRMSWPPG
ncbi:MAG: histidine triad nucleotide-binding protein [Gemmatimonadaceae bacterium]|nr:histidine triad nucleotide-binding protein [Gemmatimonadaceae bacterium]MDQ3242858.1 histidine triad nucleotide-binding protein [Gemmatimonadota bacterium]